MEYIDLGNTGIRVSKIGFGALPIQRASAEESVRILQKAYDEGINFFDTARVYTDSEEKIGKALSGVRNKIIIASKPSFPQDGAEAMEKLETSLSLLKTDYVDIIQFHNPPFVPRPGGEDGLYDTMLRAKEQGKVRKIGFTNHKLHLAKEAVESGLYETLQFPLSYLSSDEELELVTQCKEHGMGFLAMKPLAGGLLNNAAPIYWFFDRIKGKCLPLYGIQHMHELEEFLGFLENPPQEEEALAIIQKDRTELTGEFCRGCGYCLPCLAGIDLPMVSRAYFFLIRAREEDYVGEDWLEKMEQTKECIGCGACNSRCPYGIDPQNRLPEQYKKYMEIYRRHHGQE